MQERLEAQVSDDWAAGAEASCAPVTVQGLRARTHERARVLTSAQLQVVSTSWMRASNSATRLFMPVRCSGDSCVL